MIRTSEQAWLRARAAYQAPRRARALRQDELHSYRAAPALLADFAVFAVTSRTGVRTAAGITISHPRLSSLPLSVLSAAGSPNQPPQLDTEDTRQVTTASGVQLWIIPGRQGMCLATVDRSPLTGADSGGGDTCSSNLAQTESEGLGFSQSGLGTGTMIFGIAPKTRATVTIQTGRGTRRTIRPADGVYVVQNGARLP